MYTLDEIRPAWLEINLDNLAYNIKEVRKHINKDALLTAVVKANSCGHGSIEASKVFLENGADRLAVAALDEAIELRKAGIEAPILIMGYTPTGQYHIAIENNLIQTVYNYDEAIILNDKAKDLNKVAKIHIKIDSGMGRLGFLAVEESVEKILNISKLDNLEIEGIFTHFACADEKDKTYTRMQYDRFNNMIKWLEEKGLNIPLKHISNSAAIIDLPEYNLDMVRAGIMIYGMYPSEDVDKKNINLKPAMTLKTRITNLKTVPKGTGISYGKIFTTENESKIATLPIGYADGFTRMLTGKAEASVKDQRIPIVGKICMDQCMIDVTKVEDVKLGDEVVIFGYGNNSYPTVEEVAKLLGTINYEVVCMMGRRLPRVYISNGEIVKIVNYLLD